MRRRNSRFYPPTPSKIAGFRPAIRYGFRTGFRDGYTGRKRRTREDFNFNESFIAYQDGYPKGQRAFEKKIEELKKAAREADADWLEKTYPREEAA